MPMDDRPTRDDNPCLLDLDESYGRIGVGSIFSSPLVAPLSKGRPEHCRIYCYSLDVSLCQLLDVVPCVMTSLVIGHVDLPFLG